MRLASLKNSPQAPTRKKSHVSESPSPPRRGLRRRLLTPLLAVAAVGLMVTGAALVNSEPDAPTDLAGNAVTYETDATPPPKVTEKMDAVEDAGDRFAVPSVDLDVHLGALTMTDGTITPPGFTSAYLVRNLGVSLEDAAEGTVFVVMHSLRGGGVGPGNYLIDVENETAAVDPGATVTVGDRSYTVTGDLAITKTGIQDSASVWQSVPGKLVIITCLQRPEGGPSQENIVITATLNP